ncbi:class I SAM-dependent methyltransferase [Microbacterium sediminis]|uniref:SAM-dependent methyltransferase n=1 Tax=Microbacterium sediminis TaxID=904291 RepID=A0A1B9NFD6_9MICO|nr:class I SAM-dependent methyltransferase [Microbacterium sediminis]OCG75297.1 SAM-dependent methyltransferase [Microbacterium sediminis]QBR74318.1 methyltransferase domain-containing protein [Microbacterium sediminis]
MSAVDWFDAHAPDLRRRPDLEAHDLVAADASDRLILASAGDLAGSAAVVIGDRFGGITLPLAATGASVRVHQDVLTGERAARRNAAELGLAPAADDPDAVRVPGVAWHPLEPALVAGATTVLLQLPRSLDALDEIAGLIAEHADPDVRVIAGGRVKHMSTAMNDVLARHFAEVTADRGVGKSRVLRASRPRRGTGGGWPKCERHDDLGLTVCAHGAAFAGATVDIGTRFLLSRLADMPDAAYAVDLGCGTGVIAAAYARTRPGARVIATDRSWAAVASARATMAANGLADRVEVVRDDGLGAQPDASADLVLLNPPFHSDAAVTTQLAPRLFADAARVLRAGGELWCVWNSHLRYRGALERLVGPTRQIDRNAKFTVTASARR